MDLCPLICPNFRLPIRVILSQFFNPSHLRADAIYGGSQVTPYVGILARALCRSIIALISYYNQPADERSSPSPPAAQRLNTGSLSHLRTMLPESSSCPKPAQLPNHAT